MARLDERSDDRLALCVRPPAVPAELHEQAASAAHEAPTEVVTPQILPCALGQRSEQFGAGSCSCSRGAHVVDATTRPAQPIAAYRGGIGRYPVVSNTCSTRSRIPSISMTWSGSAARPSPWA